MGGRRDSKGRREIAVDAWIHAFIENNCEKGHILTSPSFLSPEHLFVAYSNAGLDMAFIPEIVRYIILLKTGKIYRVEHSNQAGILPTYILLNPPATARYGKKPISRPDYDNNKDDLLYNALTELAIRYLDEKKDCSYDDLKEYVLSHSTKFGFTDADFKSYMVNKYPFVRMGDERCWVTDVTPRKTIRYDVTIKDTSTEKPDWWIGLKDGVWYFAKDGSRDTSEIFNHHVDDLITVLQNDGMKKARELTEGIK